MQRRHAVVIGGRRVGAVTQQQRRRRLARPRELLLQRTHRVRGCKPTADAELRSSHVVNGCGVKSRRRSATHRARVRRNAAASAPHGRARSRRQATPPAAFVS